MIKVGFKYAIRINPWKVGTRNTTCRLTCPRRTQYVLYLDKIRRWALVHGAGNPELKMWQAITWKNDDPHWSIWIARSQWVNFVLKCAIRINPCKVGRLNTTCRLTCPRITCYVLYLGKVTQAWLKYSFHLTIYTVWKETDGLSTSLLLSTISWSKSRGLSAARQCIAKESVVVITRSNKTWHCIQHCND